ncbi:MAG: DMT family transporter [Armatimonadota bacterium]|nr:DMT family transporter [Armatimonadota bacterium]
MSRTLAPAVVILVLWGLWPLLAKVAVGRLGLQALWWSYCSGLLVAGLFLFWAREPVVPRDPIGLGASLLSGVLVAGGSLLFYELIRRHPASVVTFLTALYPVVSLLVGWVVLREQLSGTQLAGMVLAVAAIALLAR